MDVGLNAGLFGLSFLSFFLKYAPRFWSQKIVYGKHDCFFFFPTLSDPLSFSPCCWNTSFAELGHHTLSSKVISLYYQIVEGFQMLFARLKC